MNLLHRWLCRSGLWRKTLEQQLIPWALAGVELGDDVLEVGPGPGLTTDILRRRAARLTSIEIDRRLADSLRRRMQDTNVRVVEGDATAMPFDDGCFSGAVSLTMLHHVPSTVLQNRLLAEVHRVLKPGGVLAGSDSTASLALRLLHIGDTMVLVNPDTFAARLEAAGFSDVAVSVGRGAFRFRARR
jgi:SAM-dependent methyltransferase